LPYGWAAAGTAAVTAARAARERRTFFMAISFRFGAVGNGGVEGRKHHDG
jgi:hypothetical protein